MFTTSLVSKCSRLVNLWWVLSIGVLSLLAVCPVYAQLDQGVEAINSKYAQLGSSSGFLGQPTTEILSTLNRSGLYRHFQGGSIYWTPETGAYEVHGAIREKWASLGWERSLLGYPTTDEMGEGEVRFSKFQGGTIYYWSPERVAYAVYEEKNVIIGCVICEPPRVYPAKGSYGRTFIIPAGNFDKTRISYNFNHKSWVPRGSAPVRVRFTVHGVNDEIKKGIRVQMKADKGGLNDQERGPSLIDGTVFDLEYGTDRDRAYYFVERVDNDHKIKGDKLPEGAYFQLDLVFR